MHILLAELPTESDDRLPRAIERALPGAGWSVTSVPENAEALARFSSADHDIVIADLSLPSKNGLEVLRSIHARGSPTQVILLADQRSKDTAELPLRGMLFGSRSDEFGGNRSVERSQ